MYSTSARSKIVWGAQRCQPVHLGSLPRWITGIHSALTLWNVCGGCRQAAGNCRLAACAPQISRVHAHAQKLRFRRIIAAPINWRPILARFFECQQLFPLRLCCMLLSQPLVFFARFFIELGFEFLVQQRIHHAHRARCIEHVHGACTDSAARSSLRCAPGW